MSKNSFNSIFLSAVAVIMMCTMMCCTSNGFKNRSLNPINLSVKTNPDSALVLIDGEEYGISPLETKITKGKHCITVQHKGFWDAEQTFEATMGKDYGATIELVPLSKPNPNKKRQVQIQEKKKPEPSIDDLKTAFMNAYTEHDWEKVVAIGDSLMEKGNSLGNLIIGYAEGLAEVGERGKAIQLLKDQIEEDSIHVDYMLLQTLGHIYFDDKQFSMALQCFDKVIELNPFYARPHIFKAAIYSAEGDHVAAAESYLDALALFWENKAYPECEEFANRIIATDAKESQKMVAYFILTSVYQETGRTDNYEKTRTQILEQWGEEGLEKLNQFSKEIAEKKQKE